MNMNLKPVQILLIEDNPSDVELILQVFEWYNMKEHVHVVWDGAEALDFLFGTGAYSGMTAWQQMKAIILDLKLPKLDGIQVLRQIKSDERTRVIPVVVLTSSREDQDLVESYSLGVNSYIVKPVKFDEFTNVIRDVGHYWGLINEPPGNRPNK